jgi:predicted metal-dependent phosphoesterase TrpH
MTPSRIIEKAVSLGIKIIAICDHNTAENVEVATRIAEKKGMTVVPGMEINCAEEVHVIGLFETLAEVLEIQNAVYKNLQPGENDEQVFGMQVTVNENEEVLGFNRRLLIGATDISVNRAVELIHSLNGLAIASHIDRDGFGILGQLGFIPEDVEFDALEISYMTSRDKAFERFQFYSEIPWVTSSDAHSLDEIGRTTTGFAMDHFTFEELRLAFKGVGGRKVLY